MPSVGKDRYKENYSDVFKKGKGNWLGLMLRCNYRTRVILLGTPNSLLIPNTLGDTNWECYRKEDKEERGEDKVLLMSKKKHV